MQRVRTAGHACVFVTRLDICFKEPFFTLVPKLNWSRIMLPFRKWVCCEVTPGNHSRAADTMLWVPGDVLSDRRISLDLWFRNHGALDFVPERLQSKRFDWMVPSGRHDSNPAKDWNSLYSFAGQQALPFKQAVRKASQCPAWYRHRIARFGPR